MEPLPQAQASWGLQLTLTPQLLPFHPSTPNSFAESEWKDKGMTQGDISPAMVKQCCTEVLSVWSLFSLFQHCLLVVIHLIHEVQAVQGFNAAEKA